jgi:chloramphenicol 3-O-phosphotransferase
VSVWLVTGVMAAGKSTVARLLAERFDRCADVEGDAFRNMLVRGRAEMGLVLTDDAVAELQLRYRLGAVAADAFAAAGYDVVVQDIVIGSELQLYVDRIRSRPLHVVVLAPRVSAIEEREAARAKTGYGPSITPAELDAALRDQTPRIGLWLDTSEQTADQTVDEILRRRDEALV